MKARAEATRFGKTQTGAILAGKTRSGPTRATSFF